MTTSRCRFSWIPIVGHFLAAYALSWIVQASTDLSVAIVRIAEPLSLVIPSIAGYSAMSSNPQWASCYLIACWLGAPYYIWFFWKLAGTVLPNWVAAQTASKFWLVSIINLTGAISLIFLPMKRTHLTDASESVRATATVVSLMKEYPLVYAAVIMAVVCAFSFVSAATTRSIVLRLIGMPSDFLRGSNK